MNYSRDQDSQCNRGPKLPLIHERQVARRIAEVIDRSDAPDTVSRHDKALAAKQVRPAQADPAGKRADKEYERGRR